MNTGFKYSKLIARILLFIYLILFIVLSGLVITSIKEVLIEYSSNTEVIAESNSRNDSNNDSGKEKSVEWYQWKEIAKDLTTVKTKSTNVSAKTTNLTHKNTAESTDSNVFSALVLDKSKLIDLTNPVDLTTPKEVVEEINISNEIQEVQPEALYYEEPIEIVPLGLAYYEEQVVETEPLPYEPAVEEPIIEETSISTEIITTEISEVTSESEVTSIETTEPAVTEETIVTEPEEESWYYPTLYTHDGYTTTWSKENQAILKKYCDEYNVDYELMLAVIAKESGYNQYATSYCGAMGLCQVMPITVQQFYIDTGYYPSDCYSVEDNIHVGVHAMAACINKFGNLYDACSAYTNGLYASCVGGYSGYAESALALRDKILALK